VNLAIRTVASLDDCGEDHPLGGEIAWSLRDTVDAGGLLHRRSSVDYTS